MIKLKHVLVAPLLTMFALMTPACSMETGSAGEQASDEATETESTKESNLDTSASAATVTLRWRLWNADSCGSWCGDCSCEPTKRCKDAVPVNKPCSKRGDQCAKVAGNKVNITYYECR